MLHNHAHACSIEETFIQNFPEIFKRLRHFLKFLFDEIVLVYR